MTEIDLPPYAPVLMESTRALGYSLEAAIADLLDNSISAEATEIKIEFWPLDDPYLIIVDNGKGMSPEEITNAMQYGSQSPLDERNPNDMGRFGLGLKTASLSQCRSLTVVSLKDGIYSARQWDLDVIKEKKKWTLLALDDEQLVDLPGIDQLKDYGKGTIVVWNKFDRMAAGAVSFDDAFSSKIDDVRLHIALVFHRYLSGEPGIKRVTMYINNAPIVSIDPFLVGKSEQIMDAEPIVVNGSRITAIPYILPHVSRLTKEELQSLGGEDGMRKNQGFYVYRNRRLLVWGTWFRLLRQDELYKLARVRIDIPNSLDELWKLDIRKSTAVPPDVVRRNLVRIVNRIAEGSKRTWTFRGRKEIRDDVGHIWERHKTRKGIQYIINREHPIVESVRLKMGSQHHREFESMLNLIEASFPLNAMYVDMTEDEQFSTETNTTEKVRDMAMNILGSLEQEQDVLEKRLAWIEKFEPFSLMPEVIEQIRKEVLKNER
ncbi:MAG: ATP-binding protein [Bacillota bacterium]|nr:ATP-binding protein [Bacillota bacterium]